MGFDMSDYIDVAERIRIFRERYPEGCLQPANPEQPFSIVSAGGKEFITFCAAAYRTPDDPRPGMGTAWEPIPGPTQFTRDSELQNAETAAWGRAIVAVLAADTKHIASAQEVRNRQASAPQQNYGDAYDENPAPSRPVQKPGLATDKQQKAVFAIAKKNNLPIPDTKSMSFEEASKFIEQYGSAA